MKQKDDITSFFIRKSIYIAFFDEHIQLQDAAQTQDHSIRQRIAEQQIEQQRLVEQAEQQRIAKQQRLIEQADQQKLIEQAEQQRLVKQAKQQRVIEQAEQQRIAEQQKAIEQAKQERIAKEQRLTEERTISQDISNDKTLQEQQRRENQRKFDEDHFLNENNLLKDESNQEVSIHEIKKYDKRDTQLDFEKLLFSNNYISKESIIIEDNERLSTTHERRKNEISESTFDSSRTNDDSKIRIYYKFREREA